MSILLIAFLGNRTILCINETFCRVFIMYHYILLVYVYAVLWYMILYFSSQVRLWPHQGKDSDGDSFVEIDFLHRHSHYQAT